MQTQIQESCQNGGFVPCGRKRGGTEKRGAERPAETLSGTFGADSFCDARQHVGLANVNFPYLIKQILSRGSFFTNPPPFHL